MFKQNSAVKPFPNGMWEFFSEYKPLWRHLICIIFHHYLPWYPSEYHLRIMFDHSHCQNIHFKSQNRSYIFVITSVICFWLHKIQIHSVQKCIFIKIQIITKCDSQYIVNTINLISNNPMVVIMPKRRRTA